MAAEYSSVALQTVASQAPVLFTEAPVPCNSGYIFHREGSGLFRLASRAPILWRNGSGCGFYDSQYSAIFGANVSIPTGGTAEAIQLAFVLDGEVQPEGIITLTPADVNTVESVSKGILVAVPSICRCSSFSIRNISNQPINVQNAVLVFSTAGICPAN